MIIKKVKFFIENGYVIIRNVINKKFVNLLKDDFNNIINSNEYKKIQNTFITIVLPNYRRLKQSEYIKIMFSKEVISFLKFAYGRKPIPISTINFLKGTEQPLHSDYIHFGSSPELYLAGAWFA